MRSLFLIGLICVCYVQAPAQGKWYIASDIGLNTSKFDWYVPTTDPTIMMDIRAWRMVGKHWQLGIAGEFGKIHTEATLVEKTYNRAGTLLMTRSGNWNRDVMSPYFAPTVFAHYQADFANRAYVYAGPAVGIINGKADVMTYKYTTGYLAGTDVGVAFPFGRNVQITVGNAWRMAYVKMEEASRITHTVNQNGDYAEWYVEDAYIHLYNLKIGLIAAL